MQQFNALGKVEGPYFHFAYPHIRFRKEEFCDILLHLHLGMEGSLMNDNSVPAL